MINLGSKKLGMQGWRNHNILSDENLKIIYGGSVNSSNCSNVLKLKNVHGALIGGSSLKFKDFLAIYKSAVKQII